MIDFDSLDFDQINRELTVEQAVALGHTGWWKGKDPREVVGFQLYVDKLCMDFDDFHEAVEKALERPVWTHEFADADRLREEFEGKREKPTPQEIFTIPQVGEVIVVEVDGEPPPKE